MGLSTLTPLLLESNIWFRFLIDKSTLNIANRWRRERGEPELRLSDIGGSEHASPA
jgi:hypothetical protein